MKLTNTILLFLLVVGISLGALSLNGEVEENELENNALEEYTESTREINLMETPKYAYPGLIWKTNKVTGEMEVLKSN